MENTNKLFYNGNFISMVNIKDEINYIVVENGIITKIGMEYPILGDYSEYEKIDLRGKTMMPSFIDAHSHFVGFANSLLLVPLEEDNSVKEIQKSIKNFIKNNELEEEEWIICKGFDHNNLKNRYVPNKLEIDVVSENHPVVIQHISGHTGIFNTKALQILNIDEDTISPVGGVIEKKDGKLTGYLEENAYMEYMGKIPSVNIESLINSIDKAQEIYSSYGITTAQEGMIPDIMTPLYEYLCKKNKLYLDIVGYGDLRNCEDFIFKFKGHKNKYIDNFKFGGYKIFLDGSPQARTAWMREPYFGEENYLGYPTLKDEEVERFISRSIEDDIQILAHCNGDGAAEQFINTCNKFSDKISEIRPVMIHSQFLGVDQMDGLKSNSIIPSFFIGHVYYWGDTHIINFGEERASTISAVKSALDRDIIFTFHQDSPVTKPDMFHSIWCGVNRITKNGRVLGEDEKIDIYSGLKAITINAAYQYGEEKTKGSIEINKFADLIILEEDPLQVDIEKIKDIKILETLKRGKTIYKK